MALQALCNARIPAVCVRWGDIPPTLVGFATSVDVLALLAVCVEHKQLAATAQASVKSGAKT